MDTAGINKVSTVLCIEVVKVRNVLEVVCVDLAALNYEVGLYIIFKFGNLKGPTLGSKDLCCLSKDLCMRCGRCCYGDGAFSVTSSVALVATTPPSTTSVSS